MSKSATDYNFGLIRKINISYLLKLICMSIIFALNTNTAISGTLKIVPGSNPNYMGNGAVIVSNNEVNLPWEMDYGNNANVKIEAVSDSHSIFHKWHSYIHTYPEFRYCAETVIFVEKYNGARVQPLFSLKIMP